MQGPSTFVQKKAESKYVRQMADAHGILCACNFLFRQETLSPSTCWWRAAGRPGARRRLPRGGAGCRCCSWRPRARSAARRRADRWRTGSADVPPVDAGWWAVSSANWRRGPWRTAAPSCRRCPPERPTSPTPGFRGSSTACRSIPAGSCRSSNGAHAASLLALSALGGSLGGIAANLLAGRAIHAAGYVPVFCALGFCHLTAFAVLFITGKKGVSHE